jgi:hypothetical protein
MSNADLFINPLQEQSVAARQPLRKYPRGPHHPNGRPTEWQGRWQASQLRPVSSSR